MRGDLELVFVISAFFYRHIERKFMHKRDKKR